MAWLASKRVYPTCTEATHLTGSYTVCCGRVETRPYNMGRGYASGGHMVKVVAVCKLVYSCMNERVCKDSVPSQNATPVGLRYIAELLTLVHL